MIKAQGTVVVAAAGAMAAAMALVPVGTEGARIQGSPAPAKSAPPAKAKAVKAAMAALPARFEANRGQLDPAVRFVSRSGGHALFLTDDGAVLSFGRPADHGGTGTTDVVRMGLVGANRHPDVTPDGAVSGVTNFMIGNDRSKWHLGAPGYGGVRSSAVYPGIDLVWHGGGRGGAGGVEYDFEVAPGADPGAIGLRFDGGGSPSVDDKGALVLHTGAGELRQPRPQVFQGSGADRHRVEGGFVVRGDTVGFQLGDYDPHQAVTIDPLITYSTFLAGAAGGDSRAEDVAVDASGNAYVTGITFATNFPTTAAWCRRPSPG